MGDANVTMPNDVQVLLDGISSSFRVNPTLSFATTLVIALSLFGLIYYYVKQQKEEHEKRLRSYEALYRSLLRRLDLPLGAESLLDRLAPYLHMPEKRFLLLESEATFNACLRSLEAREMVSPALLAAVRMKLGFGASNPERTPLCSGDIALETVVFIERLETHGAVSSERKPRLVGRIATVEPNFIGIEVRTGADFNRGDRLKLLFSNSAGLYVMTSRVLGMKNGLLLISHSSLITAVQRRRHYRRKVTLRAYVRRIDGEPLFIKTLLEDLGGGGARMVNPHDVFALGDSLEVAIDPGVHGWLRLHAEVVRLGEDGTMSLRFVGLREPTRDMILRALFKRYSAYLHERETELESATPSSR